MKGCKTAWSGSLMCDSKKLKLREVIVSGLNPYNTFKGSKMLIHNLENPYDELDG